MIANFSVGVGEAGHESGDRGRVFHGAQGIGGIFTRDGRGGTKELQEVGQGGWFSYLVKEMAKGPGGAEREGLRVRQSFFHECNRGKVTVLDEEVGSEDIEGIGLLDHGLAEDGDSGFIRQPDEALQGPVSFVDGGVWILQHLLAVDGDGLGLIAPDHAEVMEDQAADDSDEKAGDEDKESGPSERRGGCFGVCFLRGKPTFQCDAQAA